MSIYSRRLSALTVVVLLGVSQRPVMAQETQARPTITATDFDFGTVAAQIAGDRGTRKRLEKMGVRDTWGFAAELGVGAADLVVEKLLAAGGFKVLERKQLAAITQEQRLSADSAKAAGADSVVSIKANGGENRIVRARYIVTGSVTRLGFEEKHLGGMAGRLVGAGYLYGLGAKKQLTEVHLTARVIDSETGEIVASFTGKGRSDRGWGVTFFGLGGWGLGGAKVGVDGVRETAIGEATGKASASIAERIKQARETMAPEPTSASEPRPVEAR